MAVNITFKCYSVNPQTGVTGERSAVISIADLSANCQDPPIPIQSISAASPGVITLNQACPYSSGDIIEVTGTAAAPSYNGNKTAANISGATFTGGVNTTGAQAVPGGWARRIATTITADKARTLVLDAATANTNGVAPGTYENVGASTFRQQ